jgi:porin
MGLASITLDTEKAGLWPGGKLYLSGVATFGRFPGELVGGLQSPTSSEAPRGALLYEAWYDQSFADGAVSLRLGQIRADTEFLTSTYGESEEWGGAGMLFANASFGFPGIYGLALPGGGPAYPMATPGARLRLAPAEEWRIQLGVFNGTPRRSAFGFRGGALAMAEIQYHRNQGEADTGLPGAYRLGAWLHNQRFADLATDTTGRSLADPLSTGLPRRHAGNWGAYVMADQLLFQTGEDRAQSIGASARLMAAPGDRNAADLQATFALTWKGALPGREDDTAGLGVTFLRMGHAARALDRDTQAFTGTITPLRGNETVLEATYQLALAGWWQLQPSLQYIARPGAGLPDPTRPGRTLHNAWVFGLRSTIAF